MGTYIPYNREVFIERLKSLRKENNLTQPQLGERLGKSRGAVGHWEAGTREPGLGTIHDLAKMFNVSVDYMIGVSDFRNENQAVEYLLEKLRESGLVKSDDTVDKKTVDKLMDYIAAIEKIKRD